MCVICRYNYCRCGSVGAFYDYIVKVKAKLKSCTFYPVVKLHETLCFEHKQNSFFRFRQQNHVGLGKKIVFRFKITTFWKVKVKLNTWENKDNYTTKPWVLCPIHRPDLHPIWSFTLSILQHLASASVPAIFTMVAVVFFYSFSRWLTMWIDDKIY